jgi:uncharacterized protein (TIGR03435 family)
VKPFVLALALAGAAFAQATGAAPGNHGPTFEVASIKVSPSGGPTGMAAVKIQAVQDMLLSQFKPGLIPMDRARVTIRNYSLLNLIAAAYRVRARQISGPEWMTELHFDVDAKISEGTPPDQVNEMLQALLAERFVLRLHRESRSQAGYALLVGKNGPKLQVSAPPAAPPDTIGNPDAQKEAPLQRPKETQMMPGSRSSHFRGMTTARLADALSLYVDGPVTDMTGLDGKYDIDLQTSQPRVDPTSGMEDPGVTIFECVAKLGLKLEARKVVVDTLVIDNVSKMPTEN